MLVSVLMDKEADFKSMLAFYEHFVDRDTGLMSWSISETGFYQTIEIADKNSATDGDLDAAYALLLAGEPNRPENLGILVDPEPMSQSVQAVR